METKEIKINVPEGYEIDNEKSTFENIVFKKKEEKRWRYDSSALLKGYYIGISGNILSTSATCYNDRLNYNVFATEKQAKSARAMARISQIMANDKRFGGPFTDDEWYDINISKYTIERWKYAYKTDIKQNTYCFLAFHTEEQRELFLEENEDLVRDYLMIDSLKKS